MAQSVTLLDKLQVRLVKLGLTPRKSKELAKGLAPTAQRAKERITEKLEGKLLKLGMHPRKAKELAKGLAPTVRATVKLKQEAKAEKAAKKKVVKATVIDGKSVVEETGEALATSTHPDADEVFEDEAVNEALAPLVNGHRLRLDLPVAPMTGEKGLVLLRVMDGWSTKGTYLVSAVKGEHGIIAVRQLSPDCYNVKFYPNMAFWNKDVTGLTALGATSFLKRSPYERMHFTMVGMEQLLMRVEAESKPRTKMQALMDRLYAISARPLVKAFELLHTRRHVAA